jgi:NAD(P)-dependent dehydrogenase (short-subunit alcohol dehydrogenase family)
MKARHRLSVVGRRLPGPDGAPAPSVRYWQTDILDPDHCRATLSEIVQEAGALDNLIFAQRYRSSSDDWTGEIETYLTGTRTVIEHLRGAFATRGAPSIVVVSSPASHLVAAEQSLGYHVAKGGLNQLVRYYAVVLGPRGIRVNGVEPGTVIKGESKAYYDHKNRQALFKVTTPLGRMGTAEEIASVILFLCSKQASFITGQILTVDGGLSVQWQESLVQAYRHATGSVEEGV